MLKKSISYRNILLVILLSLAFILSLLIIKQNIFKFRESADFNSYYYPLAINIYYNKSFYINSKPAVFRPPGYSIYLAVLLFISNVVKVSYIDVLKIFNILLYTLINLIIYFISSILWSEKYSLITAISFGIYPLYLYSVFLFSSELLFTSFLSLCVLIFIYIFMLGKRSAWILYSLGLLMACLLLIRPIAILFVIFSVYIISKYLKFYNKKTKIAFTILLFLPVIIWSSWATIESKRIVFMSTAGLPAIYDGMTFAVNLKNYRETKNISAEMREIMNSYQKGKSSRSFTNLFKITLKNIGNHPFEFAKLILWKIIRSWYGTDSHREEFKIIIVQLLFLTPCILGFIKTLRLQLLPYSIVIYLSGSIITFWIMTTCALSIVRYMVPVSFVLFLFLPALVVPRNYQNTIKLK